MLTHHINTTKNTVNTLKAKKLQNMSKLFSIQNLS